MNTIIVTTIKICKIATLHKMSNYQVEQEM